MSKKVKPMRIAEIRDRYDYNPATGTLTERQSGKDAARWANDNLVVYANNTTYSAARIAWAHHYGHHPKGQLRYANGNAKDLRLQNLRTRTQAPTTTAQPQQANTTAPERWVRIDSTDNDRIHIAGLWEGEKLTHAVIANHSRCIKEAREWMKQPTNGDTER